MQVVEHDECLLCSLFSFSLLFFFFATRNHRRGLYHRVRRVADDLTVVVAPSWTPPRIGALLRAAVRQIISILRAGPHSPSVCRSPVPLSGMKGEGGRDRPWTRASPLRPTSKKTGSSKLPRAFTSHGAGCRVLQCPSNSGGAPLPRKDTLPSSAGVATAPPMGYYLQRAFHFRSLPSDDDAASTFISMTSDDGTCIVKVFLVPVSRKDN